VQKLVDKMPAVRRYVQEQNLKLLGNKSKFFFYFASAIQDLIARYVKKFVPYS